MVSFGQSGPRSCVGSSFDITGVPLSLGQFLGGTIQDVVERSRARAESIIQLLILGGTLGGLGIFLGVDLIFAAFERSRPALVRDRAEETALFADLLADVGRDLRLLKRQVAPHLDRAKECLLALRVLASAPDHAR